MRNKPRIRFKGFTEDWEQRKLGEVVKSYSGGTPTASNKEYYGGDIPFIRSAEINSDTTELYITQKGLDNSSAKIVEKGTILYAMYGATSGEVGVSKINGAINQAILAMIPLDYGGKIIAQYLRKNKESIIGKYLQGGQGNLSANIILELPIQLPEVKESDKIAYFLESVDNIITLHQRKLEKLKLAKKALLQKLFPKNGSKFPELRFKGFADAWEQRKLLDIAKTFIGLVTTMTENYRDSGTLLIRNSDIKEGQFVFSENPIHLDEEFAKKNKTRRLQIGDVVTVHTGDIGTSAVIEEKEAGAIGFATINTRTDKSILNPYFLATYFNTEKHKCYANSVSTGDGRSNYNIKDFNKLVISVPTLDEQERISVLINDMNTIITLHQRKLDKLQEVKKGLLQKMFV